jgi:hypothetical protein
MTDESVCARCGRPVATSGFEVFEQMHYVCFHYEFEHGDTDVDAECGAGGCPSRALELRSAMREWADWDGAAFKLGRTLGVFTLPSEYGRVKAAFWTDSPLGNALHENLLALVATGFLEHSEEPDEQFRWRPDLTPNGRGDWYPSLPHGN